MGKDKKEVRFNDNWDVKEFFTSKLEKNSDIYSVKRKVINIVDDEVEDQTKLFTETQFLMKKLHMVKHLNMKLAALLTKPANI